MTVNGETRSPVEPIGLLLGLVIDQWLDYRIPDPQLRVYKLVLI